MPDSETAVTAPSTLLAYLSHSYRPQDREVNLFFWSLFSRAGFFFSVDPRSGLLSPAYLERTMTESQCFVGIVTLRENEPRIRCSPFAIFEYGLARQARKPALLLVERRVPSEQFPAGPEVFVHSFDATKLDLERDKFCRAIDTLARTVRQNGPLVSRPRGPVGLLIHGTPAGKRVYDTRVVRTLSCEVAPFFGKPRVLGLEFQRVADFCQVLDECELLIVETRDGLLPGWALGFVLGRFIPTIRLFYAGRGRAKAALPPLVQRYVQSGKVSDLAPAIEWADTGTLARTLRRHLLKLDTPRIDLRRNDDAERYFRSVGRLDAKVFISNSGRANETGGPLAATFRRWNIDAFHYREPGAIPVRADWIETLQYEVDARAIFVALVDDAYWASRYCRMEWRRAVARQKQGKAAVFTYLLDGAPPPTGLRHQQAVPLQALSVDRRVARIVNDVDEYLRKKGAS